MSTSPSYDDPNMPHMKQGVAFWKGPDIQVVRQLPVPWGTKIPSAVLFKPRKYRGERWYVPSLVYGQTQEILPVNGNWKSIETVANRAFPRPNENKKMILEKTLLQWIDGYCECCANRHGFPSMWASEADRLRAEEALEWNKPPSQSSADSTPQ